MDGVDVLDDLGSGLDSREYRVGVLVRHRRFVPDALDVGLRVDPSRFGELVPRQAGAGPCGGYTATR